MSYIKADSEVEQKYFDFLEDLRQSGEVNMWGSPPYLQAAFGLSREKAVHTVGNWIRAHSDPSRIMKKAATKHKVTAKQRTTIEISKESRR